MVAAWLLSIPLLAVAVLAFRRMRHSALYMRLLVAGAIWLLVPVALTVWVLAIGDPAPSNAVTIVPSSASPR
jgi:hypothetical protein